MGVLDKRVNPLDRQGRAAVAVPGTGARHGDCRVSVGARSGRGKKVCPAVVHW